MEGIRKIGWPCKRWRDEVEEHLNIVRIKKEAGNVQGPSEREKFLSQAEVHNGL
jgi:hypothetical protein